MSYSGRPEVDYHTDDQYTVADLVTFLEVRGERGRQAGRKGQTPKQQRGGRGHAGRALGARCTPLWAPLYRHNWTYSRQLQRSRGAADGPRTPPLTLHTTTHTARAAPAASALLRA